MPEITSHWPYWHIVWLAVLGLLSPVAFYLGRLHKRRINSGKGFSLKQQMKHQAFAAVIFLGLMLLAALARGDTSQKLPPLGSATRLNIFVDNEEFDSIYLTYGTNPHTLRVPLPPGAQTLTLMEQRNFPSVLICNPRLS